MTRLRMLLLALLITTLAGAACDSGSDDGSPSADDTEEPAGAGDPDGSADGDDRDAALKGVAISSPAFDEEGDIPDIHGLDGGNVSPPLTWQVDVGDAAELVLVMEDPDASGDAPFVHWLVAGLTPTATGIQEGGLTSGAIEGTNDFGEIGYGGPAPPPGERHLYVFTLYALDAESGLSEGFTRDEVQAALEAHAIASAETSGYFATAG